MYERESKLPNGEGHRVAGKPLGRLKALSNQVRPGERNPIEGKFGQVKRGYDLDNIRANLASTSESWIIVLPIMNRVLN